MNHYLSIKFKVLSLVAIILVIYVHSYTISRSNLTSSDFVVFIQNFISHGIARIAVPMFFLMSGYLFFLNHQKNSSNYSGLVSKKIKTVVLPYILCSIICLVTYFILQTMSFSKIFFSHDLVKNFNSFELVSLIFKRPIPYQLWFLKDLMVLFMLSGLIYTLLKSLKSILIIIFLTAWFFNLNYLLFSNQSIVFFTIGAYLSLFRQDWMINTPPLKLSFFIFIWIILITIKSILMHNRITYFLLIDILHKLGILFGVIVMWKYYDYLFRNKNPEEYKWYSLTSFTFFIFLFHEPTLTIIKKLLFRLIGNTDFSHVVVYFIAPILTFHAGSLGARKIKYHFPELYKIITGGR